MRKTPLIRTVALHCLFLFSVSFCAAEDIKKIHPTGYVSDLAGVISPEAKTRLEALCTELEQKTGAQMAIVTVQSLEGGRVEKLSMDLFKPLGGGRREGGSRESGLLWLLLGMLASNAGRRSGGDSGGGGWGGGGFGGGGGGGGFGGFGGGSSGGGGASGDW